MSNRISYTLAFTADTAKAKQQLSDLKRQLDLVILGVGKNQFGLGFTKEIQEASAAAVQLKTQLQGAINVNTGRLDLTKFNHSLKQSGQTLQSYQQQLTKLGPQGQAAFKNLAIAITNSERPIFSMNEGLRKLGKTFANTIRWQISTTALTAFTSTISNAYNYAKNLNKSLTDIRIVTGQSTEQMAKFAEKANKAAKSLSASTLAYTDAALIYYQQGLSDEEVKERTDTTVKMSNVTGESAEQVSSYMTAIWNNFADGSKELEYYSDVITALGAATAASSEEIANGLEKFAAVGETVGLSYEYATAALTTIIDKTRQSEDVVGNALKTIFARIQGLQQGETQDDGVTLNKYSKALENVGIQVLESNGELKAMDRILDELGSKWETLGNAEQVALAQTVGGVRQYTQLISLMENWDSFKENVNTAETSSGSLQEQQNIYAESWEAASKRVKASMEGLFDSLLDDDFFIGLTNGFANLIDIVKKFTEAIGGTAGLLTGLSSLFIGLFQDKMAKAFTDFGIKFSTMIGKNKSDLDSLQGTAYEMLNKNLLSEDSKVFELRSEAMQKYLAAIKNANAEEKEMINLLMEQNSIILDSASKTAKQEKDASKQYNRMLKAGVSDEAAEKYANATGKGDAYARTIGLAKMQASETEDENLKQQILKKAQMEYNDISGIIETRNQTLEQLKQYFSSGRIIGEMFSEEENWSSLNVNSILSNYNTLKQQFNGENGNKNLEEIIGKDALVILEEYIEKVKILKELQNKKPAENATEKEKNEYQQAIQSAEAAASQVSQKFNSFFESPPPGLTNMINILKEVGVLTDEQVKKAMNLGVLQGDLIVKTNGGRQAVEGLGAAFDQVNNKANNLSRTLTSGLRGIGSLASAISSIASLGETWDMENDISGTERLMKTVTTLSYSIPMVIMSLEQMKELFTGLVTAVGGGMTGLILVAIGAIAAGLYAMWNASTKTERALKEANKQLEEATKYAEDTKKAYDGLKSSIDNLHEAEKTLNSLVKGTREWKEAALSVNQQILDLITNYPILAQYVDTVNGVMKLNEEGLQKYLDILNNRAQIAQQYQLAEQYDQTQAAWENESENKVLTRKWTSGAQISVGGDASGTRQKTTVKEHSEDVGLEKQKEISQDLIKYIKADDKIDWEEVIKNFGENSIYANESWQSFIEMNIDALKANSFAIEANSAKLDKMSSNLANSYVESNKDIEDEDKFFYSMGIAESYKNQLGTAEENVKKMDEDEILRSYAKRSATDPDDMLEVNSIVDEIKSQKNYDFDNIKEAEIKFQAMDLAKKAIDELIGDSLNKIDTTVSEEASNAFRQMLVSGFNEESFKAISEESVKQEVANIFQDMVSKGVFSNELFKNSFGEIDSEKVKSDLSKYDVAEGQRYKENQFNSYQESVAEGFDMDLKSFETYQESIKDNLPGLNELLEEHDKMATEITKETLNWSKKAEDLKKVLEDNEDALNNSDTLLEYERAWSSVADSLSKLLDMDISSDFAQQNIELVNEALAGSRDALIELKELAANEFLIKMKPELDQETLNSTIASIYDTLENQEVGEIDLLSPTNQKLYQDLIHLANLMGWGATEASEKFKQMFNIDIPVSTKTIKWEDYSNWQVTGDTSIKSDDGKIIGNLSTDNLQTLQKQGTITVPVFGDQTSSPDINPTSAKSTFTGFSATPTPSSKNSSSGGSSQKEKKNASDEIERYHVENKQLDQIKNNLDKISKAKDKAFGKKRLDLLKEENKELNKQIDAQKALLKEVEKNLSKDKGALAAYGAKFDKDGVVTNYEELYQQQIDKFNNSARGEADEEAFNTFKEIFDKYEETLDLWQETKNTLSDNIDAEFENRIETIQVELELKVDSAERNIKYIEYLLERLDDKAFSAAESVALLGKNLENLKIKDSAYKDNLESLLKNEGVSDKDIAKILNGEMDAQSMVDLGLSASTMEKVIEAQEGLMENTKQMEEIQKNTWEKIGKVVEETIEGFDEQAKAISHASSVLGHYKNIVELVGQENLNVTDAMMDAAADANINNAMASLNNSKAQLETLREQKATIESDLATKKLTKSERELLEEQLKGINEEIRSAEDTMLSDWENVLEQASQEFDNAVSRTIKAFEKAMSGTFGSFERLQDAFNKQKELDDMYLDDYKKIYELSKLTRDIEKSIDSTDNIAGKQNLLDLQKEINDLEAQGVQLSEYDVENLRAKYDLRLAEIALEEAQNAKSQVRMTRDTEGNWSYVYTADENKMAEAQQNYEDKLYAMQELNAQYIENLESLMLQSQQKLMQELGALDKTALGDRYDDEVQRITSFYLSQQDIYSAQLNNALGNATDTYSFWEGYSERTGYSISANQDWVNSFEETQLSILTGFETLEEYHQAFIDAVGSPDEEGTLLGGLTEAYNDWSSRVNTAMEEMGISTEGFGEKFTTVIDDVNAKSDEAIEKSEELKDKYTTYMDETIGAIKKFSDKNGKFIQQAIEDNDKLIDNINKLIIAYNTLSETKKKKKDDEIPEGVDPDKIDPSKIGEEEGDFTPDVNSSDYKEGKEAGYNDAVNVKGRYNSYDVKDKDANTYSSGYEAGWQEGADYLFKHGNNKKYGMATGGYTGSWGSSGKLAILHEKELVLNKKDTENILKSVDMVRNISSMIDLNAKLDGARQQLLYAAEGYGGGGEIMQNITINAEFPDATDRNEIQAAFDNLFNRASQFANRKNKKWAV